MHRLKTSFLKKNFHAFQSHQKSIQKLYFHQKFIRKPSLEKCHKSQSGLHLQTCATQEKVRPVKTSFNWAISNLSRLNTKSNSKQLQLLIST